MKYASVVFDTLIKKPLDYSISEELTQEIKIGTQVEVLVRGHQRTGYVFAIKEHTDYPHVLPIKKIISSEALSSDLLTLALWMSNYYCAPLSQVVKCMLPSSVRKDIQPQQQIFLTSDMPKKKLRDLSLELTQKHPAQALVLSTFLTSKKGIFLQDLLMKTGVSKSPIDSLIKKKIFKEQKIFLDLPLENYFLSEPKKLNEEQQKALKTIAQDIERKIFATHLLFGVTGSGKTEVYLHAIQKVLDQKQKVILLVPEVALTSQTIERFKTRFHNKLAVLHHKKSHGERSHSWKEIFQGNVDIVIGARSAVFSPLPDLGLIILDEEHDLSYKQTEEPPTYHARQVAIMRAKIASCPIILGSATPSFETFYNAEHHKHILSTLSQRANKAPLCKVQLIDMRLERMKNQSSYFSEALLEGIKKRYTQGEQTILFLNRRGFHNFLICQKCSSVVQCPHCDLSLTYHKKAHLLRCHSCGYHIVPLEKCPSCSSREHFEYKGFGTEHVEAALHKIFPDIRTLRMDRDTTSKKDSHDQLFKEFRAGKADVLIGTQMVVKGFHFPSVTLVGVLNTDGALHIPDFRSSEYVFQLLTQVAGRAGRADLLGEVLIQTYMPENSTIQQVKDQDYRSFYQFEMENRKSFSYPPYTHMVKIQFSGSDEKNIRHDAALFRKVMIEKLPKNMIIHPVIPSGRYRVNNIFRLFFIIRTKNIVHTTRLLQEVKEKFSLTKDNKLLIDIDPVSTYF
ncbi:MAG: primosomal protein N' [Parachlamydiales bacterium]|nr:primosomal protein N' [Parachlamydiales bacterium]